MEDAEVHATGQPVSNMVFIVAEGTQLILRVATTDKDTRIIVLPPGTISMTTIVSPVVQSA
jgi:hypothetical protein